MKLKSYGMPYKGSKNSIAKEIVDCLPSADCLVDLFGGGGAITHYASLTGKYKKVIYNELNPLVYKGFKMAVNGEFEKETRWIGRETFFKLKDTDPYAAIVYSFGNNLVRYLYSEENEKLKEAVFKFILNDDKSLLKNYLDIEDLNFTSDKYKNYLKIKRKLEIKNLDFNLESLTRLLRIQSLSELKNKNIEFFNLSYEKVEIPNNSIVYCDIPYKDTYGYEIDFSFDHDKFYKWCLKNENLVFVSEYEMPNEFYKIKSFKKVSKYNDSVQKTTEKETLFCNKNYCLNYNLADLF